MLLGPDSVVPPGPVAVARTVPEPESGLKAPPLRVADHRLPDRLAKSVVGRPATCTRNVTRRTCPEVPVDTVAVVDRPQPDRLATVVGETDGVNTPGGRGRVVVVVATAGPGPRAAVASPSATAPARSGVVKRPMTRQCSHARTPDGRSRCTPAPCGPGRMRVEPLRAKISR